MEQWINQELAGCEFADARLGKRFGMLMDQLSNGISRTIPLACGDWAATKAAYRFLDNDRVSEAEILAGHFQATRERFAAVAGPVLVLHDTTEFSYTRENAQAIGLTHKVAKGHKDKKGRQRMHTVCGILMHSSLNNSSRTRSDTLMQSVSIRQVLPNPSGGDTSIATRGCHFY